MRKFSSERGAGEEAPSRRVAAAWLLLTLVLAACAVEPTAPPLSEIERLPSTGATRTIFVISNGWHSSIVFARTDLPPDRIPEAADFPQSRFLEFGWGDAEYYPAEQVTFGMTLRAALMPTPAVVHVAGLSVAPARRYPKAEIIPLLLDAVGLGRLVNFIDASFERGGRARAIATGPGLYPTSRFYPAADRFHLLNTCNTWTARALVAAGFPVAEAGTASAEDLMLQVRLLGKRR